MPAPFEASLDFARAEDDIDIFFPFRERFHFPQHDGQDVAYFCGNSLGLQPKSTAYLMQQELDDWAKHGVEGHFRARNPWFSYHQLFSPSLARIVGAEPDEVVAMNTLTVNLHLLMISFYQPTQQRYKIIMEAGAFPSDQYAMETQVLHHGFAPEDAIIEIAPRAGSYTIEEEDVLSAIAEAGEQLALVVMGGVHYYSGQAFDIARITKAAHEAGALAGWDLAHAVGNVELRLHDWDVDFACWCSYKYLNSGPGGVGGAFVHTRHSHEPAPRRMGGRHGAEDPTMRLGGWWGHDAGSRFKMQKGFVPQSGAAGWQMSNAPVFNSIAHRASLDIFDKADLRLLREKSVRLTGYFEWLLRKLAHLNFTIITPDDPARRGAQLSLLFGEDGRVVFDHLTAAGIVADWREPNVIRMAPAPLYARYEDVYRVYEVLRDFVPVAASSEMHVVA